MHACGTEDDEGPISKAKVADSSPDSRCHQALTNTDMGGGKKGKEAILVKLGILCVRTVLLFRNLGDWSLNLPDSYRKGVLALNEEVCCILWALLLARAQIPSRAYFFRFKYRNLLKISFNDIFTFKKNVWIFKMLFISEVVHCLVDFSLSLL